LNEYDLPARPILSPHFGFKVLVGSEVFTVISIASVNLQHSSVNIYQTEKNESKNKLI
jgi:hypothetical protein